MLVRYQQEKVMLWGFNSTVLMDFIRQMATVFGPRTGKYFHGTFIRYLSRSLEAAPAA